MAANFKYSCNRESEFFTTEIDIAYLTNITHERNYYLSSKLIEM